MKNEKTKNINIELDEKTAQGKYSNLVVVNHSPTEFVLDFVNIMPGSPKAKVSSRIIITPQHAKKFLKAIIFKQPFIPRRGRINCSLNDDGRWRWFGTQFTIRPN